MIIHNGAVLVAGTTMSLNASADVTLAVRAVVPSGGDVAGLTLAVGRANGESLISVRPGSRLTAPTILVTATNTNSYSTLAISAQFLSTVAPDLFGSGFSAGVGAAAALGFYQSFAQAQLAGFVETGALTVTAHSENLFNQTRSFATVDDFDGSGSDTFDTLSGFLGDLDLGIPLPDGVVDPNGAADFTLAAAITFAATENKAAAWLDDGADVDITGDLTISSHAVDRMRTSAVAATSGAAVGVAGAANVGRIANQATAFIGYDAVVDVFDDIVVDALAEVLSPIPAFDPNVSLADADGGDGHRPASPRSSPTPTCSVRSSSAAMAPLAGHLAPFLGNPDTVGTAYVHAGAATPGFAFAGGVNFIDVYGMAAAGIAGGARVNQDLTFGHSARRRRPDLGAQRRRRPWPSPGSTRRSALAGGGPTETSVGGYFGGLFVDNYARALIDDRAHVTRPRPAPRCRHRHRAAQRGQRGQGRRRRRRRRRRRA